MIVQIDETRFNELLLQCQFKRRRVGTLEFTEIISNNKVIALQIGDSLLEQLQA